MPRNEPPIKASRLIVLAAVCVTVAALYFARDVLIPLALSVLLSFLLVPLVARLERAGVHRVLSVVIVVGTSLALVGVLGWVVYIQVLDLAERLPTFRDDIALKIRSFIGTEPSALDKAAAAIEDVSRAVTAPQTQPAPATAPAEEADLLSRILTSVEEQPPPPVPTDANPMPVRVVAARPTPLQMLGAYVGTAAATIGMAAIVLVFVIFMLIGREHLRDRLIRLVGYGQLHVTTQALDDAATRISRYLLALSIVNGTYGIAIAIGLWLIGYLVAGETFPNFILWGMLCAVLRFIPYIGPWVAASFPILLSFAVFPGYSVFIAVASMFVVVEVLSNNFMEPWLYGTSTGMSVVAIITAAVFWTWLWGPIGLVMATPLTVCLVVIGKYVPQLRFFDVMLGDEPVLTPPERIYQRLLAMDQEEATEVLEQYMEKQSLEEVFDTVLLPALALAEVDRHAGRLDEERAQFIRGAMRDMIDELADEERLSETRRAAEDTARDARGRDTEALIKTSRRTQIAADCVINVVLLPAHDAADEIVARMLAELLQLRGYCGIAVSHKSLISEMLDEVEKRNADLVVVSALPPAAATHARYMCKRLHTRFDKIAMIVGLWTVRGDLKKAKERILCTGNATFGTTLAQALEQIHEQVQPRLIQARSASQEAVPSVNP